MPDYPPLPGGGHNHFDVHGGERDAVTSALAGLAQSGHTHGGTTAHPFENVLAHGAVGNAHHITGGGTDDTAAIQAAYNAAQSAGGYPIVVFPGRRTYRVTQPIQVTPNPTLAPVHTIGLGSTGANGVVGMPVVVGDIPDGRVFEVKASGNNLPLALFRDIAIKGRAPDWPNSPSGMPENLIWMGPSNGNNAKIDSGTGLDNVWLAASKGDALHCAGRGMTNFWIRGGRWDQINGYGLYANAESTCFMSIRDVTWDNWVAGNPGHGRGFIHFDMSGAPGDVFIMAHLDGIHTETNADMIETSTGGDPADRRGIIRCTIAPATQRMQFFLTLTHFRLAGWNSSNLSHCLVQMAGGTAAQRTARLQLVGHNLRGFAGTGTASTGHVIPVGGVPSADKPTDGAGHYWKYVHAKGGDNLFGTEQPRSWELT